MTIKERAGHHAARDTLASVEERVEAAIREELEALIVDLEAEAERKIKMYADIGMDGEREAFALQQVALQIRNRLGIG